MFRTKFVCRKRAIVILFACGALIYILNFFTRQHFSRSYQQIRAEFGEENRQTSDVKLILSWTRNMSRGRHFKFGFQNQTFLGCPTSNCKTTFNRSLLNQSDAVIFHVKHLNLSDLPLFRLPHQRWILFMIEPPQYEVNILNSLNNIFNWTMTYRLDSDIPCPYSVENNVLEERMLIESKEREAGVFDQRLSDLLSKKNKTVAWVVSNCGAPSGRSKYVEQLKKYIDVSIYGKCNYKNCSRTNCFETLGQQYKFYLSFENSLCRDYVTEKFYNSLLNNMVPIVYGSANYSKIPELESAYIDARKFYSVQDLANYLHYLDKNDEAYQKYFEWRRKPAGLSVLPRIQTAWCNLCQMLSHSNSFSTYQDMKSWWVDKSKCGEDKQIFELQIKRSG